MSEETRDFLGELTKEDVEIIKAGIPIIRAIVGFGKVMKWLVIIVAGCIAGLLFLGESIQKVISWFKLPPN
jgi:hypothetical protein